jgi:sec-independent protein translocase protein TatB
MQSSMLILPLFLDISGGEFLLIVLAAFIVFGPKKMPEIARQLGKTMNELKKTTSDITREFKEGADQVKREVQKMKTDVISEVNPLDAGLKEITASVENEASQISQSVRRRFGTGLGDDKPAESMIQPESPKAEPIANPDVQPATPKADPIANPDVQPAADGNNPAAT